MTFSSNSVLPAAVAQPDYAREQIKPRIVHLGFGAFFRAHQAVYAEQLANEHASDWGYSVINMHNGQKKIADLRQQNLLYTELVSDVLPYEEIKLRMLNGSHSFLAYLGYLVGYTQISDCMLDAIRWHLALLTQSAKESVARLLPV